MGTVAQLSQLGLNPLGVATAVGEGYGASATNIPTLANNPVDLSYGPLAQQYGATSAMGSNIAVFPSLDSGVAAANAEYGAIADGNSSYYTPSESLAQYAQTWAGGGQGSSSLLTNVEKVLGIGPGTPIGALIGANNAIQSIGGTVGHPSVSHPATPGQGAWNRVAIGLLGLILLGVGAAMFRPVSDMLVSTARTARTAIA